MGTADSGGPGGTTRREFLAVAGAGLPIAAVGGSAAAGSCSPLRAKDVAEHFVSRAPWVHRDRTVDRVVIGNPDLPVDRCLVAWMPSFKVLRRLVAEGRDFLVCHEPVFWNHRDERPTDPWGVKKLEYIEDHHITIVRNHDCWDRWPKIGIPSAWGGFLGLGEPKDIYQAVQHRYDIETVALDVFAARVARCCARLGEPMVQVTGDGATPVSRIGIGTGCICDIGVFVKMGCDCSIVVDDGGQYWSSIQRAADAGHPVIRVHHGVAEEPGMATLAEYINANLPGLTAVHLPQGCTYRLAGGG